MPNYNPFSSDSDDGGGWYGKARRGDFGGAGQDIGNNIGIYNRKGQEAANGMRSSQQEQSDEQRGVYDQMNKADSNYAKDFGAASSRYQSARNNSINSYLGDSERIQEDADRMASDARMTYDTDILGRQKNIMNQAQQEAGNAMSLQEAGNVNNSIHRSVRGLYDQQAQGVRQQGMADAGVLGALGMQNMAGQMAGAAPMTGGQMQAMMGQNMSQSGQAFARAQQYAQSLKEQGINRGFEESDKQYERGQRAKDRYTGSINDFERSYGNKQQYERDARNEKRGYISDRFGIKQGQASDDYGIAQSKAGIRHGNAMNSQTRELQHINDFYGNEQGWYGAQAQAANADQARKLGAIQGYISGGAQAAGSIMGGMMGGPGGAAAGQQGGAQAAGVANGGINTASAPVQTYSGAPAGGGYRGGGGNTGGYSYGNGYSAGYGYGPSYAPNTPYPARVG